MHRHAAVLLCISCSACLGNAGVHVPWRLVVRACCSNSLEVSHFVGSVLMNVT